jgi:hypothetical protein|tara:strand:+ start:638 stop:820 length:183 start_codon:yes stop_codon:yes gene_type:complete
MMSKEKTVSVAIFARCLFLLWSVLQDEYFEVPFTDIDYFVVSDASRYAQLGFASRTIPVS